MNDHRNPNASSAFSWFVRAIEAIVARPLPILGGSVLGLLALLFMVFVLVLLAVAQGSVGADVDPSRALLVMVPAILFALVAGPWLMAGIATLFHEKQTSTAIRVFAGLSDGRALALVGLVLIPLVSMALTLAGYRIFGGPDYLHDYFAMFESLRSGVPPVAPVPEHPFLLFFWEITVSMGQYLLQMLAIPQVQIGRTGPVQAMLQSAVAILRQPAASLMAIVVFILITVVLFVVMLICGVVFALLAALSPGLAMVVGIPVIIFVMASMLALFGGVGYFAWVDLMAPPALADAKFIEQTGIEV